MALVLTDFKPGDSSGAGPTIHTYTTPDTLAVVNVSGYFDDISPILAVGDKIYSSFDSDGSPEYGDLIVLSITAGVVVTGTSVDLGAGLVEGSGATVAITAAQSGKTFLFDRAAGIVYTLPVGTPGLKYNFETTVDLTAAAYAVLANVATAGDFFVGAVNGAIEAAATGEVHFADGTTHLGISSNSTTTGGLIGGFLQFECIKANLWTVKGVLSCTATPATPFTT